MENKCVVVIAEDIPIAVFKSKGSFFRAMIKACSITDEWTEPITQKIRDELDNIGLGGLVRLVGWNDWDYVSYEYIEKEIL